MSQMGFRKRSGHGVVAIWVLRIGVIVLVAATLLFALCSECVDALYMLASGRWMSANGAIQVENVASAVPGMRIVVQNWLLCVVYWRIYELGLALGIGFFAVRAAHMASMLMLYLLVWNMAKSVSRHPVTPWVALGVTALGYSLPDIRVHALATLAMVTCMWIADQVMEGRKAVSWLALIPLICVIHANVQSALAILDALMALCIAILSPQGRAHRERLLPTMGATLLGCLGCLVTPYGIDGILYAGSIRGVSSVFGVWELSPLGLSMGNTVAMGPCAIMIILIFAMSSISAIRHERRRLLASCLLTGGFLVTACLVSRMLLQANAAAIFLSMIAMDDIARDLIEGWHAKDVGGTFVTPMRHWATVATIFIGACAAMSVSRLYVWEGCQEIASLCTGTGIEPVTFFRNSETTPWNWSSLIEGEARNVLCSPNVGSYMEFLGHKVTVSSRWEAWTVPCDISANIFRDTIATMDQKDEGKDAEGLVGGVSRIDWDYAFVSPVRNAPFCDWLAKQPDWEEVSQEPIGNDWKPYVPSDSQPEKRELADELPYRIWKHVRHGDNDRFPSLSEADPDDMAHEALSDVTS